MRLAELQKFSHELRQFADDSQYVVHICLCIVSQCYYATRQWVANACNVMGKLVCF